MAVLHPRDTAIASTSDAEKFIARDGKRIHWIFDPATASPAEGSQSVTVVAESCADAESLSRAIFVMGPSKGLQFAEDHQLSALIVAADGRILVSTQLKPAVTFVSEVNRGVMTY
jgi:thiamine biosynthesis lipoprotein